jgi:exodeoxyribonuclease VII large subunit
MRLARRVERSRRLTDGGACGEMGSMDLFDHAAQEAAQEAARQKAERQKATPAKGQRAPGGRAPAASLSAQEIHGHDFDDEPGAPNERDVGVLTVTQLTGEIESRLKGLGRVAVEGEISGLKKAGSGHIYFTLKDGQASVSCAIWRSRVAAATRTPLEEGQRVVCHGRLDVYKPRGSYSLIVERVERRGLGEMLARLEKLKADLRERGWFDRSRPIPDMPKCIGVVTSRDADAWRDFLRTRSLRWPAYPVRLRHTRVQGPGAAAEVAQAIAHMASTGVDLICVVRGGGSLEDLWTFNEAAVAEAVWACPVPVISGVGHESDHTLIDMVADHRAHTPTDAAQTVIPDQRERRVQVERQGAHLDDVVDRLLEGRTRRLVDLSRRRVLRDTRWLVEDRARAWTDLSRRLRLAGESRLERAARALSGFRVRLADGSPVLRVGRARERLARAGPALQRSLELILASRATRLEIAGKALEAISPLAVLERGYSITRAADGRALRSADEAQVGQEIETILHAGRVRSTVKGAEAPADDADGASA